MKMKKIGSGDGDDVGTFKTVNDEENLGNKNEKMAIYGVMTYIRLCVHYYYYLLPFGDCASI